MAWKTPTRFRRKCRVFLRRFRLGVLVLIFVLVGVLVFLNQHGVPDFIKRPVIENLRARGLDLQFSRLRWRWSHGFVAENVHLGSTNELAAPALKLKEVQVRFNHWALARFQFQVDSLLLRQGRLSWPVITADGQLGGLAVEGIQTELHFRPGDLWELSHFQAQFAGVEIQMTGAITNATAIREWPFPRAQQPAPPGAGQERLRRLADILARIHFAAPPQLQACVFGDARDLRSFDIRLNLNTPEADTPWGAFHSNELSFRLVPAGVSEPACAEAWLQSASAQTPWGVLTNLSFTLHAFPPPPGASVIQTDLNLAAGSVETRWGRAAGIHFLTEWSHSITNPVPLSGRSELELAGVETIWGGARRVRFTAGYAQATGAVETADETWAWWGRLAPFTADWECRVDGVLSPKLEVAELFCAGQWRAPMLRAARLSARLYGGRLEARADVNVATRELSFTNASDFDGQKIAPLLTPKSRKWLENFSWAKPPKLRAAGAVILPAWTNRHPDWRGEVKPTIRLAGYAYMENGAFRGVPLTTADTRFNYTNEVWRLPDLVATRPEGRLNLSLESDEKTRDYHFHIFSTMDPRALRPALEPPQQRGLDLAGFAQPPVVEGDIWGRWYEPDLIGASVRLAATNFTLRGQPADSLRCGLEYTNRVLRVIEPRLERAGGSQFMSASSLVADFTARKIYVTNGFGKADPLAVARAIGPRIGKTMEPYRFIEPPAARVEGVIPMQDTSMADLHFDAEAGAFECWKFRVPRIKGRVDWIKDRLQLNKVEADFYQGRAWGDAEFDFSSRESANFHFDAATTNTDLHLLMNDLLVKTNQLEGVLDARLTVTRANTKDWKSWQGGGRIKVRDGLIWDSPIFGIVSPALNAMMPGLGNSRAGEGSATFRITNSVISSDNLRFHASMMRLKYRGTVDFKGNLDARVEAELLRNTPLIGPIISTMLWPVSKMFGYKVTGTLQKPHSEALILTPFRSDRPFKELAMPPVSTPTNTPPQSPP